MAQVAGRDNISPTLAFNKTFHGCFELVFFLLLSVSVVLVIPMFLVLLLVVLCFIFQSCVCRVVLCFIQVWHKAAERTTSPSPSLCWFGCFQSMFLWVLIPCLLYCIRSSLRVGIKSLCRKSICFFCPPAVDMCGTSSGWYIFICNLGLEKDRLLDLTRQSAISSVVR